MTALKSLSSRIADASHDIAEILRVSGTPSLSYAVIHLGQVIHTEHLGFRDVEEQKRPDNDTRHNINSLTKALVASLTAMEVAKGTLAWSSKIKDLVPGFTSSDPLVQDECTILDLLSHSTGLSTRDNLWSGPGNNLLLDRSEALPTFAALRSAGNFRASFVYNNWAYEIVGQILEKVTGKALSELLHERIFAPLNMTRTSTSWADPQHNNAKSYTVLDDLSTFNVPSPAMEKGQIMEAAGGVKSSLADLTRLYQEMLRILSYQLSADANEPPMNVFRDCLDIFSLHNPLPGWSLREQSYGAGWCRAQLPGQLGRISENAGLGAQPIVGNNSLSRLVIYHHGSMCGSQTVVNLLPETQSAVIALQNSLGPVVAADFAAQLLIERLIDAPNPVDYLQLTRGQAKKAFSYMDNVKAELDSERELGTSHRPLEAYCGTYWNPIHNWRIEVSLAEQGNLTIVFQGVKSEPFILRHYHYNTFSWWMPYNDIMRAARFAIGFKKAFWLMHFEADSSGKISKIKWAQDTAFPDWQETFALDSSKK